MKKQIRYYFTDFWSSFDFTDCFWYIFSEYDLILNIFDYAFSLSNIQCDDHTFRLYGNSKMYVNRKILEKRMNMKIKSIGLDNRLIRSVMTSLLK